MENTTSITNNFYVGIEEFLEKFISQDRQQLIQVLKDNNIIVELTDGLYGVSYVNFEDRENENHTPEVSLKRIS